MLTVVGYFLILSISFVLGSNITDCGLNEVYSECGNNGCQNTCKNPTISYVCRARCISGCICADGYLRNSEGVCVLSKDCESKQCNGKNEIYSSCVSPCGETCATLGRNIVCNFLVCNPGCDCKPGFYRNSKNECVSPTECDCDPNEELDLCHNPCPPRTCEAIGKLFKCSAIDTEKCKPACKCKFNYRRNADGECVPIETCPPLVCSNPNEVYDSCPEQCLDEKCTSIYDPLICTAEVRECQPQCVCISDHLRDDQGICILKTKCKSNKK